MSSSLNQAFLKKIKEKKKCEEKGKKQGRHDQ